MIDLLAPVKVWAAVPQVILLAAELTASDPPKLTISLAELFQVAPAAIVTSPVKVLAPVALLMTKLPVDPPPTVVVPVTVRSKPAAVKVVPSAMESAPPMVVA